MKRRKVLLVSFILLFLCYLASALYQWVFNRNLFLRRSAFLNQKPDVCLSKSENLPLNSRFQAILEKLLSQFWQADGNWGGDMMHDATSFAPSVLYPQGRACREGSYSSKADQTIDYELGLLSKIARGNDLWPNLYPASFGFLGLTDAAKAYEGSWWKKVQINLYLRAGVLLADVIYYLPWGVIEKLTKKIEGGNSLGTETITLIVVEENFSLYELTKNPFFAHQGLRILNRALAKYWQQDYYSDQPWSWPEAMALSSFWKAYAITGHQSYLENAEKISRYLDKVSWDNNLGLYREIPGKSSPHQNYSDSATLSGNLFMAKALLDGNSYAGQETLLRAEVLITQIVNKFYAEGLLKHHLVIGSDGSYQPASSFCTGCNFFGLSLIYRLSKAK